MTRIPASEKTRSAGRGARPTATRALAAVLAAVVGLGPLPRAFAQGSGNKAAAQVLFDEGRRLMTDGKFAEACPKLAESQRLDPGVGTQFNLSDCYERMGRTASAWAGFLEVAASARSSMQPDREQVARQRAMALEPKLSKLTIMVAPATAGLAGIEVRRDGELVGAPLFGVAAPVDPGAHQIAASAPGKVTFTTDALVKSDRDAVVVNVPELLAAPPGPVASVAPAGSAPPVSPAPPPPPGVDQAASQRRIALVLGAVGVVAIGAGTAFAISAKKHYDDSLASCHPDDPNVCNDNGFSIRQDARAAGNIATVTFGIGLTALAVATYEWLSAPSSPASGTVGVPARGTVGVAADLGPSRAGVVLGGAF